MKKLVCVVLTLALLVTLTGALGGCEREKKPLTILVDLANGLQQHKLGNPEIFIFEDDDQINGEMKDWLLHAKEVTGIEDIELEILPAGGAERSSRMTRLRTEMMSGQGPDVFIVAHTLAYDDRTDSVENISVFLMPEKSMNLGLFYPLDDFIENAQYMEWDKLNQNIMAAGRSEEYGQVLLPLFYELPITLFPKSLVEHTPSKDLTWEDMIGDETKIMQAAASSFWMGSASPLYAGTEVFGRLADYKNKKMCFTEEELLQRYQELKEMDAKQFDGSFDDIPLYYKTKSYSSLTWLYGSSIFGPYLNAPEDYPFDSRSYRGLAYSDFLLQELYTADWSSTPFDASAVDKEVTMIPAYSDDGGVTASVRAFAAINANTKRPEDAFTVLDYLFSERCMYLDGGVYSAFACAGMPVRDDMIQKTSRAIWHGDMEPANYEEYKRLTDCITTVTFADTISLELNRALWELYCIDERGMDGDPEEIVHSHYTRMKRALSE